MRGGSYESVMEFRNSMPDKENYECHHLLYKSALSGWYELMCDDHCAHNFNFLNDSQQNWAPTILMTSADHRKTLSYVDSGNESEAIAVINAQQCLLTQGDIVNALKMEIRALHCIFGDKYNQAIEEASSYFFSLNPRIQRDVLSFDNPVNHRRFTYDFSEC